MRFNLGRFSFDVVRVDCGWCRKFMKLRVWWKTGDAARTSHGICSRCEAKLNAQLEAMK